MPPWNVGPCRDGAALGAHATQLTLVSCGNGACMEYADGLQVWRSSKNSSYVTLDEKLRRLRCLFCCRQKGLILRQILAQSYT